MTEQGSSWADHERFAHLLQQAPWRFAYTMPKTPHHYTLRKDWSDSDFDWAVTHLRTFGYDEVFGGRTYRQADVNNHFYWTMGAPLEETILINRRALRREHPYDEISYRYDTFFRDDRSHEEEAEVLRLVEKYAGPIVDHDVLDVGCGTGLLLNHVRPDRYVGIDPSPGMVSIMRHRYPDAAVINTDLEHFAPSRHGHRYSLILGLFGTASYLTDRELSRVLDLLTPDGVAVLMFYGPDYQRPVTHQMTGVSPEFVAGCPAYLPATVHTLNQYEVAVINGEEPA